MIDLQEPVDDGPGQCDGCGETVEVLTPRLVGTGADIQWDYYCEDCDQYKQEWTHAGF